MEIHSKHPYPSNALSNFAARPFKFDGVDCGSMEGLLQSLKFEDPELQAQCAKLSGIEAKNFGSQANAAWTSHQTLWWKAKPYPRLSEQYADLVLCAYESMARQCPDFIEALRATLGEELTHSIGTPDPSMTVLTEAELCHALNHIRRQIQPAEAKPRPCGP